MGLFGNKNQKLLRDAMKSANVSPNSKMCTCAKCGRRQKITYFSSNDSWTCPQCKSRNYV